MFLTAVLILTAPHAVTLTDAGDRITVETDKLRVSIRRRGYVSGTEGGSFLDKATGAKDLGFGLHVMDFLMAPGWADDGYERNPLLHGNLPKHYVEGPQVCTQAKELEPAITRGADFLVVSFRFAFTKPAKGLKAGSVWRQTLLFRPGVRYFLSAEAVTSANDVADLFYRVDMPGHVKHTGGDSFEQVYLSYHPTPIPASAFDTPFGPDAKFLYRRDDAKPPKRMIRGYKVKGGPWLAGLTLDPAACAEAWCHERGYVCFIEELHRRDVKAGQTFGAAYAVGWFDDVAQMNAVYDEFAGKTALEVSPAGWKLTAR